MAFACFVESIFFDTNLLMRKNDKVSFKGAGGKELKGIYFV